MPGLSLRFSLFFFNNTPLLKSRSGTKEVVIKIKKCVVDLHFNLDVFKDKSILFGVASPCSIFFDFFKKLMIVSQRVMHQHRATEAACCYTVTEMKRQTIFGSPRTCNFNKK